MHNEPGRARPPLRLVHDWTSPDEHDEPLDEPWSHDRWSHQRWSHDPWADDWPPPPGGGWWVLEELLELVGSEEALQALDAEPLPDEPFAWHVVPAGLHDRLAAVLEIVDQACADLFDVELRTAARRLAARAMVGDSRVLGGRGRIDTAAAGLVWIVASANGAFARHDLRVMELQAHLGLRSSPSQRAYSILRAAGIETSTYPRPRLADPSLLVAAERRSIIDRRDRYDAARRSGARAR
jgi:hypothetical protein